MIRRFFDIETSPNIGFFWRPGYKLSISHENILHERAVICIAWKDAGSKKVHSLTWDKEQNDRAMLEKFVSVMHGADELIGHNSDKFDTKWIRTRCIKHGIPMMPTFVSIDTLKMARQYFNFNSNTLKYITDYLGVGAKIKVEYDLWKAVVFRQDDKALRRMVRYCKRDVEILEKVFDKMNNYIPAKTHQGEPGTCPECRSKNITINKTRISAAGMKRVCYQCKDCGKYATVAETRVPEDWECSQ